MLRSISFVPYSPRPPPVRPLLADPPAIHVDRLTRDIAGFFGCEKGGYRAISRARRRGPPRSAPECPAADRALHDPGGHVRVDQTGVDAFTRMPSGVISADMLRVSASIRVSQAHSGCAREELCRPESSRDSRWRPCGRRRHAGKRLRAQPFARRLTS